MYQIIWAKEAETDYIGTLNYWIQHNQSVSYSQKIISEVETIEEMLSENPSSGTKTHFKDTYKVKILKYFHLYYQISDKVVEIVSFWDNRRNPNNLLNPNL